MYSTSDRQIPSISNISLSLRDSVHPTTTPLPPFLVLSILPFSPIIPLCCRYYLRSFTSFMKVLYLVLPTMLCFLKNHCLHPKMYKALKSVSSSIDSNHQIEVECKNHDKDHEALISPEINKEIYPSTNHPLSAI